ncbi:MAG: Calx-beta domain-containing protein [Vicinamibacteraceae bacterium]
MSFVWSSSTVAEETGEATVGVRVTTATGAPLPCPVAVHYETRAGSAAPGRDFTLQAGTLTFAAGTASATTKSLSVPVINEASDEDNQGFVVFLTGAAGAQLGTHTRHTVAIVDDDGLAHRILLSIRVEEPDDALRLLEGLDQPIDQDAVEAPVSETNAILVMLVEGVHGHPPGFSTQKDIAPNASTSDPDRARSAPITSQGLCPSPASRVTGISRAEPLAG